MVTTCEEREQLQPAEQEVPAKRHERVRGKIRPVGVPLLAGQADLVHQPVDDDAGRRERRQRARLRAVAHHDDHQERGNGGAPGDRHRHRRQQRGGRHVPGPQRGQRGGEHEEHHRNDSGIPAADAHGAVRNPVEGAVQLRLRKQQRHAGERQKQRDRETGDHLVQRHAAEIDADDPGQGERQNPDVQLREAADENRNDERGKRHIGKIHSVPSTSSERSSTAGWMVTVRL